MWCLAFLLLARFGFASCQLDSVNRPVIPALAAELETRQEPPLRTVVFGSSLMRAAFAPYFWDIQADQPQGSAINMAVDSGVAFDALHMARVAEGALDSAELFVIEVAYWSFNRNWLHPRTNRPDPTPQEVRQWGTLSDRLAIEAPADRARFVADFFWPLYQRREPAAWVRRIKGPWTPAPQLPGPPPTWNRGKAGGLARRPGFRAENIALDHFHDAELSRFELHCLDQLLAHVSALGARAVLARLPTRRVYLETAWTVPGAREFAAAVDREIELRLGDRVTSFDCLRAEDCGLRESWLVDYGHMTQDGAHAFTRRLFDEVSKLKRGK